MIEKPTVLVSACVAGEEVRYNGVHSKGSFFDALEPHIQVVKVCPETGIGLNTPRDPVRLAIENGEQRLVQPATDTDWTDKMKQYIHEFFEQAPHFDGAILKHRSPSCGLKEVKIYQSTHSKKCQKKDTGIFGGAVKHRLTNVPVEDEGRLNNPRILEHFLTGVFASHRLRVMINKQKVSSLVDFHGSEKYLLMGYNQKNLREMGRLVANSKNLPILELLDTYRNLYLASFSKMARYTSHVNVIQHIFGYFKTKISIEEKAYFLDMLNLFTEKNLPSHTIVVLLKSWALRFQDNYLLKQSFFNPFPEGIMKLPKEMTGDYI